MNKSPNSQAEDFLQANQSNSDQQAIHLLDGVSDPAKVIATQQALAGQVEVILRTIKQYENDPAIKAAYLSQPGVQNTLHSFGDAFAHVDGDGTHYPVQWGHAVDSKTGHNPDDPNIHPDAYQGYVNALFSVASQATVIPRVSNSTITNLVNQVTSSTSETGQVKVLNNAIGSVSPSTSSSLVNSPVGDCGSLGCANKPIGSQVNPQINSIYGIKK